MSLSIEREGSVDSNHGNNNTIEEEESKPSSPNYSDPSANDLTVLSGAALLTADCMGTGILALPHDMQVLGSLFGLTFLILNLPINLYAGSILGRAADFVEKRLASFHETNDLNDNLVDDSNSTSENMHLNPSSSKPNNSLNATISENESFADNTDVNTLDKEKSHQLNHDTVNTVDFIGMATALYDTNYTSPIIPASFTAIDSTKQQSNIQQQNRDKKQQGSSRITIIVTCVYYTNIVLVLGNYILVMSHAVAAMIGEENICLPVAGIIASTLMFCVSQMRTMATLGRTASVVSLLALAIVVTQCLVAIKMGESRYEDSITTAEEVAEVQEQEMEVVTSFMQSLMRQLAALASIGFAVGSQKLFLNIRHEFKVRDDAPKSLAISLATFGSVYTLVCILAGPNPPSFLFDAISPGIGRKVAGFLLWVHVAVSFAINSQALCSSLDRLCFYRVSSMIGLHNRHKTRWAVLTMLVAMSSYFIANAVPFFKDLVALIGALTSVPLTLLLPAIFHRKIIRAPLFTIGSRYDILSYLLIVFSLVFLICGIVGSLSSIEIDWAGHGPPFSCH